MSTAPLHGHDSRSSYPDAPLCCCASLRQRSILASSLAASTRGSTGRLRRDTGHTADHDSSLRRSGGAHAGTLTTLAPRHNSCKLSQMGACVVPQVAEAWLYTVSGGARMICSRSSLSGFLRTRLRWDSPSASKGSWTDSSLAGAKAPGEWK